MNYRLLAFFVFLIFVSCSKFDSQDELNTNSNAFPFYDNLSEVNNFPKMVISTNNQEIFDEPKINAELKVIEESIELDYKIGALDTDIKSLKKAARQNVSPEILKRIDQIIKTGLLDLRKDFKIYWNNSPIAKLSQGRDYLNPEIDIIADDSLSENSKSKLIIFLNK